MMLWMSSGRAVACTIRGRRVSCGPVPTDADCLDYWDWLRWPDGFVCPQCRHAGGWLVADGR
ncbi:MAG: transposase [Sciscionella sp.]